MTELQKLAKLIVEKIPYHVRYDIEYYSASYVMMFYVDLTDIPPVNELVRLPPMVGMKLFTNTAFDSIEYYFVYEELRIDIYKNIPDDNNYRIDVENLGNQKTANFPINLCNVSDTTDDYGKNVYEILLRLNASICEFSLVKCDWL